LPARNAKRSSARTPGAHSIHPSIEKANQRCFNRPSFAHRDWDDTDSYCPHCDNKFVLPAKKREKVSVITFEGTTDMIRDERQKPRDGQQLLM